MPRKQIVLRIDENALKAIEKWAGDEFRSVNGQIEWILTENLKKAKRLSHKNLPEGDKKEEKK